MRKSHELVTKRISERFGLSEEDARIAQNRDWHMGTRYCDGGFDFEQPFEIDGSLHVAYYYHVDNNVVIPANH